MNERVKELREFLGLTLEQFGNKIGVTKSAISKIESGERKLSNQTFLSICREYNVNPLWLEKGGGPIFIEPSENSEYMSAAMELSNDSLFVSCLMKYSKMRMSDRAKAIREFDTLLQQYEEEES